MSEQRSPGTELSSVLRALCDGTPASIGVTGAAVTVGEPSGIVELLFATDAVAEGLADVESATGRGPGSRALESGSPVLVPDVVAAADPKQERRDDDADAFAPALWEQAERLGVGAVFAFPLQLGALRLGVLHLYRTERGELDDAGFRQSVILADRLTHALLGVWGTEPPESTEPDPSALSRAAVHQATGMLVAQLGVGIDEAFARMRTHAFAEGRPLTEVADDIVARRLRIADSDGET